MVNAEESAPSERQIHLGRRWLRVSIDECVGRRTIRECQSRCLGFERRWSTGARGHCAPNINADVGADNKGTGR